MIIICRGLSNKYDFLVFSMFCGRCYFGEVVFDEVDFLLVSFCVGFFYFIIKGGGCYFWKGKGCDVDEFSCVKFIGMDFVFMGELIEIEDGLELDVFWGLFDGGKKLYFVDYWRFKLNYSRYGSRLFCLDVDFR